MDDFHHHDGGKVFCQPRPRDRIEKCAADGRKIPEEQQIPDHRRNHRDQNQTPVGQKPHIGADHPEKPVRMPRRQLEKHIGRRKPQQPGILPHLLHLALLRLEFAIFRSEQVVLPEEIHQFDHLRFRHRQPGIVQPLHETIDFVVLIHLADHQRGIGVDAVVVLRKRIKQHRIVAVSPRPDQFDVLTQCSGSHIRSDAGR